MAFTFTAVEELYISQSQRIHLPVSKRPLLFVNQNLVVTAGSMKASNTSATGLRINISVFAIIAFPFNQVNDLSLRFHESLVKETMKMPDWSEKGNHLLLISFQGSWSGIRHKKPRRELVYSADLLTQNIQ